MTDTHAMRAAYEEAVRLVPEEPPSAARALVLAGLSRFLGQMGGDLAAGIALAEQALAVARAAGAREVETRALMPLGAALVRRGDVEAGLAAIERARVVASELRDTHELANAMSWMASYLHDAGRYVDAVAAGLEAETFAARHGLGARWATNALFWTEESLVALGRWDEAGRALDRAEQHELHGASQLVLETKRLRLATRRGEVRAAARHVTGVQQRASSFSFELTSPALAEFALWSGDPRAARIAIAAGSRGHRRGAGLPRPASGQIPGLGDFSAVGW